MNKSLKLLAITCITITFGCANYSEKASSNPCYPTTGIYVPKEMNKEIEEYFLDSTDIGEYIKHGGLKNEDIKLESAISFIVNELDDNYYFVNANFRYGYYKKSSEGIEQMTFKYDKKTNKIIDYVSSIIDGGKYTDTFMGEKYENNVKNGTCNIQSLP